MRTLRSAWLACVLCALAATTASGQGPTAGALSPPKNDSRQQREDSLKADEARKSGEMATQPRALDLSHQMPMTSTNPVQRLQAALKAHGHDPGPMDGMMSQRTQEALRAYQAAQRLKVTGQADQETLDRLGVGGAHAGLDSHRSPRAGHPWNRNLARPRCPRGRPACIQRSALCGRRGRVSRAAQPHPPYLADERRRGQWGNQQAHSRRHIEVSLLRFRASSAEPVNENETAGS